MCETGIRTETKIHVFEKNKNKNKKLIKKEVNWRLIGN
jgi:hypothetical protein